MNFLKNFFKNNGSTNAHSESDSSTFAPELPDIHKELFADNGVPEKEPVYADRKSLLREFLEQNFYHDGYNDGYDYPSDIILESGLAKIKSDYIYIIEKKIDEIYREIIIMKEHSVNVSEISGKSSALCESIVEEQRKLILKLIGEKELCLKNEGNISAALNSYTLGFQKGVYVSTQEKMLGISTGIFN